MVEHMPKTLCPRCGQDWVVKAVIKPLRERIFLCPECDAFWKPGQTISAHNFTDFGSYVESRGCDNKPGVLELVGD